MFHGCGLFGVVGNWKTVVGRADRRLLPFPVLDGHVQWVQREFFPVSPLLSISGLSGIFLIACPAHDASSVSGCGCSDSVLPMPTFSGFGVFDRPARECDLNVILKGRGGATSSDWSSLPSGRSKVAAEPGEEARKPGRGSGRSDSISTLGLRDIGIW